MLVKGALGLLFTYWLAMGGLYIFCVAYDPYHTFMVSCFTIGRKDPYNTRELDKDFLICPGNIFLKHQSLHQ